MKGYTKILLSGNEAVARGAYEADCKLASAYPGTPSTEIIENISKYKNIYCEWSTNEKVALEVALGASLGGARALYASKHVGLNVASDPLFSSAYIGVRGGFVIVTADDPGLHSSQNEQDNRFYAISAKLPVLCPSDSQEVKDFTKLAFDISERFDIPVLMRLTTRISHSKSLVEINPRRIRKNKGYKKDIEKANLLPSYAKPRHYSLEKRLQKLKEYSEKFPYNRIEWNSKELGFIADGIAYQYAKEAFPDASFLKLSMVHPFPDALVKRFCKRVKKVIVVEENDPFIEFQVKALGFKVYGKEYIPRVDELNPTLVEYGVKRREYKRYIPEIPKRPPLLCPGCPHRPIFYILSRLRPKPIITGDIGCYTLGTYPPLNAMDTCVCMGASITLAHGLEKANASENKIVAVIGDSTFLHSGITGAVNVIYNQSHPMIIILDNLTTAMTGHQPHPGTGKNAKGEPAPKIEFEKVLKGSGFEEVYTVDPYNYKETQRIIKEAYKSPKPVAIVARRVCSLLVKSEREPRRVDKDKCISCGICLKIGCPAISYDKNNKAEINPFLCFGDCGLCAEVCPKEAIE